MSALAAVLIMMMFIDVNTIKMVKYTEATILAMEDKFYPIENNILINTMDDKVFYNIEEFLVGGNYLFLQTSHSTIANEYDIGNKPIHLWI